MHRIIQRLLMSALFGELVVVGASMAQPPGEKDGPPKGLARPAPLGVEDLVERIMAFDKDKKGKVTRDDLPERMHFLIELGDTNKDGALDRDEIRKLAAKLAANAGELDGGPIRLGPAPGGAGGRFGADFSNRPEDVVAAVVKDLKLSGKKKEQALAAVKAHQENVRKLMEQARAEVLEKMRAILSEKEFQEFRAALDRPRGQTIFLEGPGDGFRRSGRIQVDPPKK
jgi:hypothetical protein